jgi:hypothetical protein
MRIGIMLRHYEQQEGGVKVYTRKLLPLLLSMGEQHRYVLIYQNPKLIGTYAAYPNVEEVAVRVPGTVLWDQIAVPWVERRKQLDLIFNPKFTVPFLGRAKRIFVLHGSEWFLIPASRCVHRRIECGQKGRGRAHGCRPRQGGANPQWLRSRAVPAGSGRRALGAGP